VYTASAAAGVPDLKESGNYAYGNATKFNPTSPLPHFLFGRFLAIIGEHEAALVELQSAILLKPDYQEALSLLGDLNRLPIKKSEQNAVPILPEIETNVSTTTSNLSGPL